MAAWTYQLKQVNVHDDHAHFIISLFADGSEIAGREIALDRASIDGKPTDEIALLLDEHAKVLAQQLEPEHNLKTKVSPVLGVSRSITL